MEHRKVTIGALTYTGKGRMTNDVSLVSASSSASSTGETRSKLAIYLGRKRWDSQRYGWWKPVKITLRGIPHCQYTGTELTIRFALHGQFGPSVGVRDILTVLSKHVLGKSLLSAVKGRTIEYRVEEWTGLTASSSPLTENALI